MTVNDPGLPPPDSLLTLYLWLLGEWLFQEIEQINKRMDSVMAEVKLDQAQLDDLATALGDVGTNLAAEIASLKVTLPDADFSGVEAQVAALQALEVPAPAPPTP